jgi:hypothetical protein
VVLWRAGASCNDDGRYRSLLSVRGFVNGFAISPDWLIWGERTLEFDVQHPVHDLATFLMHEPDGFGSKAFTKYTYDMLGNSVARRYPNRLPMSGGAYEQTYAYARITPIM